MLDGDEGQSARQRVRKKRSAPRKRRAVWIVLPVVGGLVVLLLVAGGLLARDVATVRAALLASQQELRAVQQVLGTADLDAAEARLRDADAELATARSRSRGPLWNLAAAIPVIRQPVQVVRGVVDVATAATEVATVAVRDGGALLTGGLDIRVVDGQVDLAPIEQGAELVASLPVEALRSSAAALAALDPGLSPQELVDARSQSLALATDLLDLLDRADALLGALPGYLGAGGPRTYFLGVQTSAELRSTGGLIGFYSTLTVDDGAFTIGTVDVYDALDDFGEDGRPGTATITSLSGSRDQRATAPADFLARYAQTGATTIFSNVNVDPDLPLTAGLALELFELRTGQALDGLILLDAIGLQAVLEATGTDVALPADLIADTDLPEVLPASAFARFITEDIYADFGSGRGAERRALLSALGGAAFDGVFSGGWDGVQVARTVADITADPSLTR